MTISHPDTIYVSGDLAAKSYDLEATKDTDVAYVRMDLAYEHVRVIENQARGIARLKEEISLLKNAVLYRGARVDLEFIEQFNNVQSDVHKTAREKGWWDKPRNDAEMIALMHSELSEALEELRRPTPSDISSKRYALAFELADVVIRIMDFCQARELPLAESIIEKNAYNKTRERKHGKEF